MRAKHTAKGTGVWKIVLIVIPVALLAAVAAAGYTLFRPFLEAPEPEEPAPAGTDYIIDDGRHLYSVPGFEGTAEEALRESGAFVMVQSYEVTEAGDGTVHVLVHHYPTVTVVCDGGETTVTTELETAGALIRSLKIRLGKLDRLSCGKLTELYDGMTIRVYRVREEFSTAEVPVPYTIEYQKDDTLEKGKEVTTRDGQDGVLTYTYKSVYVDDVLEEFTTDREEITTEPVNALVLVGTKEPEPPAPQVTPPAPGSSGSSGSKSGSSSGSSGSSSSSGSKSGSSSGSSGSSSSSGSKSGSSSGSSGSSGSGSKATHTPTATVDETSGTVTTSAGVTYNYTKVIEMTATAYTYDSNPKMNITSSGVPVQVGVVAALPSTLPQGTRVYIVSPNGSWEYGVATVGDKPGRDIIDLFMETESECINFGVRDALVYILE